jgi:hypothetical protein
VVVNKHSLKITSTAALLVVGLTGGLTGSFSCQRSGSFKKDQEYYKPEAGASYYGNTPGGKTPTVTDRVVGMGQPKKRVIILNFWNDTPVKQAELGSFAADELRRGLALTQRMIITADMSSDKSTEDFVEGDQVRVAQLIREGRKLGVSVLGIGRVTRVAFRQRGDDIGVFRQKQSLAAVNVEMKLFDVPAGREMMASAKSGEASSNNIVTMEDSSLQGADYRAELTKLAIRNAVAQLVPDVVRSVEKLTWEGRIAKVSGTKVYINAGKASGLVGGDILRVMAPGDDIYDPATGAFLGRTKGQLKGTLEVNDFLGSDGAITEVHTGGNFQENDIVQLY